MPQIQGVETRASNLDERLPYPDKSFDAVVSACGLEHIAHPYHGLCEFSRVTRVGGRIFLLIPNVGSAVSRLKFMLFGEPSEFPYLEKSAGRAHIHLQPLHLNHVNFIARDLGLEVESVTPIEDLRLPLKGVALIMCGFLLPLGRIRARHIEDPVIRQSLTRVRVLLTRQLLMELTRCGEAAQRECVGDIGEYESLGIA